MVNPGERRGAPRSTPQAPPLATVRIRTGDEAHVLNYSETGIYVSSSTRLLPGRPYVLAWPLLTAAPDTRGIVVRSAVGALDAEAGVRYHAAVQLDRRAEFLGESAARCE